MSKFISYEVQSFREGKWTIDSVYDEREMAIYVAKDLLDSSRHKRVQVLEERYDDTTGEAVSRVIFNRRAGEQKVPPTTPKTHQSMPADHLTARSKPKEGSDFIRYLTYLVLAVGGILLTVIIVMFVILEMTT